MNLTKAFKKIESVSFAIEFSVISGFKVFQRALEENKTLLSLIADLRQRPERKDRVLERLIAVLQAEHSAEYQHPNDIPIAAYLFVLYRADPFMALGIARQLTNIQNLWWARLLAQSIVDAMNIGSMEMPLQLGGIAPNLYGISSTPVFASNYRGLWEKIPMTYGLQLLAGSYKAVTIVSINSDLD